PDLSKRQATVVAKASKPKATGPQATDITINMRSTESLDLDWHRIWRAANHAPYAANVSVEIVGHDLHGTLTKSGPASHHYQPALSFSGRETINYRFKQGKALSKTRKVQLVLTLGDLRPQIRLAPMAKSYEVGERVTLDASGTKDEKRQTLRFAWQQTGGTPVRIEPQNKEGSVVAFVVPSSFYTATPSGPTLRVTAIDENGQEDSQEIRVNTVSRRKSPLWGGTPGSQITPDPDCPQGRCPGDLLPWRYTN
ncbi:MAG: hypothetical protein OEV91_06875, partial [Desulfobulbaceae bacterium]|nr:hypothetical protein [Desulfobulbaceae bacterium]